VLDFISSSSIFYISCPAKVATGGPELLHQLALKLKQQGRTVHMCYFPVGLENPVHENYVEYGLDYVSEIEDLPDNVLIVPEVKTQKIYEYKNIKTIVWWLSVDNYFKSISGLRGRVNNFILNKLDSQSFLFFDRNLIEADAHLVQSHYAAEVLHKFEIIGGHRLSDFLHGSFLEEKTELVHKENIIAYNPAKGIKYTKKLMDFANDLTFVPIQNMTREQVIQLLKRAKVYIDFGNHPGKDRIPREAAYLHACVITNKKGSARYYQDVPILDEYKFDGKIDDLPELYKKIKDCFGNYEKNNKKFNEYREVIKNQEKEFTEDSRSLFMDSLENMQ